MIWPLKRKKKNDKALVGDQTPNMDEVWPTFGRDKCDNCPQDAKVRVFIIHQGLVLDFCGHHFRKHEKRFHELGYIWIDGRKTRDKFSSTKKDIHAGSWHGTFG